MLGTALHFPLRNRTVGLGRKHGAIGRKTAFETQRYEVWGRLERLEVRRKSGEN